MRRFFVLERATLVQEQGASENQFLNLVLNPYKIHRIISCSIKSR